MKKLITFVLTLLLLSCGTTQVVEQAQRKVQSDKTTDTFLNEYISNDKDYNAYHEKLFSNYFKDTPIFNEFSNLTYKRSDNLIGFLNDVSARIRNLENTDVNLIQKIDSLDIRLSELEKKPIDTTTVELKAFPSALGAGAYVTGGRGKPIYKVTNLNNSGDGSLRQCLQDTKQTDGGIITFDVSGTIVLTSEIYFYNQDNISILGQTAPEGGITLSKHRLRFQNVNNLIMRYIRVRPTNPAYPASEIDAFEIFASSNYIIDHCSFSWGTDEAVDSGTGNTNYTWQRNLMAESKTGMILGGEPDKSYDQSFLFNAFYNSSHRFPNVQSDGRVDVIGNVAWNFRGQISVSGGKFKLNHIANHYTYFDFNTVSNVNKGVMYQTVTGQTQFPLIYTKGNYVKDLLENPNVDNWLIHRFRFNPTGTIYSGAGNESALTKDFQTNEVFPLLGKGFEIPSANEAFNTVSNNVGANRYIDDEGYLVFGTDAVDAIYLTNIKNKTRVSYTQDNVFNTAHRSAFINSISTTPINRRSPNFDTDNDGMSDAWERRMFGNLNQNANGNYKNNVYTNFDLYTN